MLLNEITTSDELKINKINKVLKETFGFTLVSEIKTGKLNQLYTQIADDLYNLKLNLSTAQEGEYVQKLLVLEGLKLLMARNNKKLEEAAMIAGRGGRKLELVVNKLADYVRKACDVGDSYETAIDDAMRAYELWPYRFDRELVAYELRKLTIHDCSDALEYAVEECGMMEAEECSCKDCDCDPCECGKEELEEFAPAVGAVARGAAAAVGAGAKAVGAGAKAVGKGIGKAVGAAKKGAEQYAAAKELQGLEEGMARHPGEFEGTYKFKTPNGSSYSGTFTPASGQHEGKYVAQFTSTTRGGKKSAGLMTPEKIREFLASQGIDTNEEELDEVNSDRYAEQDWVRSIRKDKATAAGDDELALSLAGDDEEEADDYFSYNRKKKTMEFKEGTIKELRQLLEAEVDQAESLIAAKSFSQELQDMVEKLGRLVNEDLPAVADQMRDSHGSDVATGFEDTVSSTLNGIMDSLRNSKQELDNSVSSIADGGMPAVGNDMDDFSDEELGGGDELDDLDVDGDVELDLGDEELGDEFGGEEVGDIEEPLGRAKKESLVLLKNKIVEAQKKIARLKAKQ